MAEHDLRADAFPTLVEQVSETREIAEDVRKNVTADLRGHFRPEFRHRPRAVQRLQGRVHAKAHPRLELLEDIVSEDAQLRLIETVTETKYKPIKIL